MLPGGQPDTNVDFPQGSFSPTVLPSLPYGSRAKLFMGYGLVHNRDQGGTEYIPRIFEYPVDL